ncbi:hypothetical protein ScPMuIL_009021 [Solemya velum]
MRSYDGYFLLEYLIDQSMRPQKIIYNGSKIMYLEVGKGLNIQVLDSLNFLPMKLAALPKAFGLKELKKGYFPHFFNTTANQKYVGPYPDPHYYGIDYMSNTTDGVYGKVDEDRRQEGKVEKFVEAVDPFDYVTIASVCMGVYITKISGRDLAREPRKPHTSHRGDVPTPRPVARSHGFAATCGARPHQASGAAHQDRGSQPRLAATHHVLGVLDLNEGEVQWLSSHLAHTVKTHKDYYRLQEAAVEIGKVSKLLLLAENGEIAKYSGQSLEDIDIDDSVAFEADEENIGEEDFLDEELSDLSGQNSVAFEADEDIVGEENFLDEQLSDLSGQTSESSRCERQLLPVTYRQSDDELDDSDADPVFDPESDSATETTEQPPQKRKKRWTDDEKLLFKSLFKRYIQDKILPPGKVLQNALKKLQNRTIFQIRTRIHNIISGKQAFE